MPKLVTDTPLFLLACVLQDDFYLNLVDWSSTNTLAVGLASCVYLWSAQTSSVVKLCDLADIGDSVTSIGWIQRVSLEIVCLGRTDIDPKSNVMLLLSSGKQDCCWHQQRYGPDIRCRNTTIRSRNVWSHCSSWHSSMERPHLINRITRPLDLTSRCSRTGSFLQTIDGSSTRSVRYQMESEWNTNGQWWK